MSEVLNFDWCWSLGLRFGFLLCGFDLKGRTAAGREGQVGRGGKLSEDGLQTRLCRDGLWIFRAGKVRFLQRVLGQIVERAGGVQLECLVANHARGRVLRKDPLPSRRRS